MAMAKIRPNTFATMYISEPTNSLHFRWSSKVAQGNEVLAQQISDLNSNIISFMPSNIIIFQCTHILAAILE